MGWFNLPHLPTRPLPVTAKHRMVEFQIKWQKETNTIVLSMLF